MAVFCLPPDDAEKFVQALKNGVLDPFKLRDMDSAARRAELAKVVGEDNAKDTNALLENAILKKDQQSAFETWAKKVAGLSVPAQRDFISRLSRMDKLLTPAEEKAFLADAVEKKLGFQATADETARISQMVQTAKSLREDIAQTGWTPAKGIEFGRAANGLDEYVDSLKPGGGGWGYWAAQIANIPRTSLTSILHWSAPFVQGRVMMTDPAWFSAFRDQMRYFASGTAYDDFMAYVRGHPYYDQMRKSGLAMTDLSERLQNREEAMQSSLLQEANAWLKQKFGIPDVIGASSRSFTGFLNNLRFNSFVRLMDAEKLRTGAEVTPEAAANIAKVINNFTGRGNIGLDRYPNLPSLLNAVFFAPRKWLAMIERPFDMLNANATARGFAMREMMGYVGVVTAVTGLAKMSGAQVGLDPRKSDFMQIRVGTHTFDLTEGESALIRLMSRIMTQQYVTKAGKTLQLGYNNNPTSASLIIDYMRNKLAPLAAVAADFAFGKDALGQKPTFAGEAQKLFMPITVQEFHDWAKSNPQNYWSLLPAMLVPFGLHMSTDQVRDLGIGGGPANDELSRLGFSSYDMGHPTGDPHFDDLIQKELGPLVQDSIGGFVQSQAYKGMDDQTRTLQLDMMMKALRKGAVIKAAGDDPQAFMKLRMNRIGDAKLRSIMGDAFAQ